MAATATRATGYFTTEKLSARIERTPEGYLLCRDVPVARIGTQMYAKGEIPVEPGPDGLIIVERRAEEVFAQPSLDSYVGKPITMEHPPGNDVSPDTHKQFSIGIVLNPRVKDDEEVLNDFLITDPMAIRIIEKSVVDRKEKLEVSVGYDCEYMQTAPGRAWQKDIIVNHVAIVEEGRCGIRCAIGDSGKQLNKGRKHMKLTEWAAKVKAAFTGNNQGELATLMNSMPGRTGDAEGGEGGDVHLHMSNGVTRDDFETFKKEQDDKHKEHAKTVDELTDRVEALEEAAKGKGAESTGEEGKTGDKKATKDDDNPDMTTDSEMEEEEKGSSKTGDSANLGHVLQRVMSQAEIIVPGVPVMTLDAKASPKVTLSNVCAHRRKVIGFALSNPERAQMVEEVRGGRTLDHATLSKMTCGSVRQLFDGVHALVKAKNTADHKASTLPYDPNNGVIVTGAGKSPSDVNKSNREYWKNRS